MAVNREPMANDVFGPLVEDFLRPLARANAGRSLLRAPEADVVETEREILVTVDVPGCGPGDVELVLENNLLTMSGERRPEWKEEEKVVFHLAERRYGHFSRSFVLPRDVDHDAISARFDNGVLTVSIPKSEKARRRKIQIQEGRGGQTLEGGTEVH